VPHQKNQLLHNSTLSFHKVGHHPVFHLPVLEKDQVHRRNNLYWRNNLPDQFLLLKHYMIAWRIQSCIYLAYHWRHLQILFCMAIIWKTCKDPEGTGLHVFWNFYKDLFLNHLHLAGQAPSSSILKTLSIIVFWAVGKYLRLRRREYLSELQMKESLIKLRQGHWYPDQVFVIINSIHDLMFSIKRYEPVLEIP